MATVIHEPALGRYACTIEGHLSVCEYVLEGDTMVFTHTHVPPELRGRGVAEQLVRAALADAVRDGRPVRPDCSYVARFLERHPDIAVRRAEG